MKLPFRHRRLPWETRPVEQPRCAVNRAAFTMIEIALCLAIIGFALVVIIGILPLGMNTQRDTREETIINQDASMLLEAIRGGSRGVDDLTNYVYAITNTWTDIVTGTHGVNGYTYNSAQVTATYPNFGPYSAAPLTNGVNIIGLLSTPELIAGDYLLPGTNYPAVPDIYYVITRYGKNVSCYSNHVVAYVRSLNGLAAEKPPQNNQIMQEDTFSYRVLCVNAAAPVDTNIYSHYNLNTNELRYAQQLMGSVRELRLLFMWPQYPNGAVGNFRQNFRASIAGQLGLTNWPPTLGITNWMYLYQPEMFSTNTPWQ